MYGSLQEYSQPAEIEISKLSTSYRTETDIPLFRLQQEIGKVVFQFASWKKTIIKKEKKEHSNVWKVFGCLESPETIRKIQNINSCRLIS